MLPEELFDIFGNHTRRKIIRLLSSRPFFKTELAEELRVGQKAVNDHLIVLKKAGLVETKRASHGRGRPRKYVSLKKTVVLNAAFGPSLFDARCSGKLSESEKKVLKKSFPDLFGTSPRELAELEALRDESLKCRKRMRQFLLAIQLLEERLKKISECSKMIASKLELSKEEKGALLSIIENGGRASPSTIELLEKRGLVKFNPSSRLWEIKI